MIYKGIIVKILVVVRYGWNGWCVLVYFLGFLGIC